MGVNPLKCLAGLGFLDRTNSCFIGVIQKSFVFVISLDGKKSRLDLLRPDYIQGLTLTGGDPLLPENREVVEKIVHRVWTEFLSKKDVWLWTGYKWEDLWNQNGLVSDILADINVLVDGPFIESEKDISLPYMGSKNQRVIDIKWSLGYKEPTLWWTPEKKGK